ncbi:MAG: threonylcarbamoyl-AMP synthase [Phycisphaeraceae bacterium]|nr:threonylcarbamoyl-AMP synthase [Phycisphaeraceae bacterium]
MGSAGPDIHDAVRRLREGGLVAFPTETVYGLGADALNEAAVRRVFEAKGRPANNPMIVHVRGPESARPLVAEWSGEAAALTRAFWPGPLTIVLPKSSLVPEIVTGGGPNVGLRCPDHPLTLALLFEFGGPLVGPSANRSGYVSPTRAEHVRAAFGEDEVMVLDGGRGSARVGIESTVLSLAGPRPVILRPGAVTAEDVERVIGVRPVIASTARSAGTTGDGALPAPGQLARHYAPRLPTRMECAAGVRAALARTHEPVCVLSRTLETGMVGPEDVLIAMPADAEGFASALYEALREADESGRASILIEEVPGDEGLWGAIADRLRRACTAGEGGMAGTAG